MGVFAILSAGMDRSLNVKSNGTLGAWMAPNGYFRKNIAQDQIERDE